MSQEKASRQKQTLIVLVVVASLVLFFVNTMIQKSIREVTAPAASVAGAENRPADAPDTALSDEVPSDASVFLPKSQASSSPSKSTAQQDKEIIYEPSIKDNILLQ